MQKRKAKKRGEFKRLRELAGLTLGDAAGLLKVDPRTVYRYDRGETKPTKLAMNVLRQAVEQRVPSQPPPSGFRFIDLFAGIGGMRLGFEAIGGRCVFTSEWDLKSQETYALNFPNNHPI